MRVADRRIATGTIRHPETWIARVVADGQRLDRWEEVSEQDQVLEALLMGLRLAEGVAIAPIEHKLSRPLARIALLEAQGLVALTAGRLRATPKGRLVLNAVLKQLAA